MAKFRSHYSRNSKGSSSFLIRLMVYGVVLILLLLYVARYFKNYVRSQNVSYPQLAPGDTTDTASIKEDFLPSVNPANILVHHTYFSLSYVERHEQAEWVAYELTVDRLNEPKQDRFDYFSPDLKIKSRSAVHRDYTGSGYTRGHLAPAADMAFDPVAARECFFMSNISPQTRAFNNGIWRELEENVRDWARTNQRIWVVAGPVLSDDIKIKIGDNRVSVPQLFYKVILDYTDPVKKGIAFLIPNEKSELPLKNFAISIDSIERLTSINFFATVSDQVVLEALEKQMDIQAWPVNAARYTLRKNKWNKQE